MKIDRSWQLKILALAENKYPESIETDDLIEVMNIGDEDIPQLLANIAYLQEYELIKAIDTSTLSGIWYSDVTITSKGIDFITPDGGLSAELKSTTMQLDDETLELLRKIMLLGVEKSNLPKNEKNTLKKQLAEAGSGALQDLTKEGLGQIFKLIPQAVLAASGFII